MLDHSLDPPQTPAPIAPTWGWRDFVITLLVIGFSGALIVGAVRLLATLTDWDTSRGFISPPVYIAGTLLYLIIGGAILAIIGPRAGWRDLGLQWPSFLHLALVPPVFIFGMGMMWLTNIAVMTLLGEMENPQIEAISGGQPFGGGELVVLWLLIGGIVPVVEELFFRGALHHLLRRHLSATLTIVVGAAIFAIVHFIPMLVPGLFVAGLCLGYLREQSGSIWPGVIFHMLQNTLALLAMALVLAAGGA
ncbi:CPBP family intramembrane glutamic endopeptidase [Chloroflexus sp.]|uniref:CPBP family intramembrane glutamic endopeptidase n=1 Tax=Chloroflexus sp. TaxID=1904827 RepID=UPI00260EF1BB|nr:CPBP family intramembrane glutamic endopeptidase [uncultured Chloroflexus sp.]